MRLNYIPRLTYPNFDTYGALYNWYAATNSSSIAASGWSVPTKVQMQTLLDYLGGDSVAGGHLKQIGTTYWESPNIGADNSSGMFLRGGGARHDSTGDFSGTKVFSAIWCSDDIDSVNGGILGFITSYSGSVSTSNSNKKYGYSIRLIKNSTSLSNGQTSTYTGNDGTVYPTICVGTQEWISINLIETKYRDGSAISKVTDNSAWVALTTGARCSYNNA